MSLFFKAHGHPSFGLLFIRLTLGTYTMCLGIMQANNIEDYIAKVKAMHYFSENVAFIFGFITPFLLIIFGALYIMGFFTPITSILLAIITIVKVFTIGLFPSSGIPFNKDLIFFVCFLTTLFAGAGVISFDALLDRKKKQQAAKTVTAVSTVEVVAETPEEIKAEEKPAI